MVLGLTISEQILFNGIVRGMVYALVAIGIVLVHRASGVVNFAHGATGMVGTFVWWDLYSRHGHPFWLAFIAGVMPLAIGFLDHAALLGSVSAAWFFEGQRTARRI